MISHLSKLRKVRRSGVISRSLVRCCRYESSPRSEARTLTRSFNHTSYHCGHDSSPPYAHMSSMGYIRVHARAYVQVRPGLRMGVRTPVDGAFLMPRTVGTLHYIVMTYSLHFTLYSFPRLTSCYDESDRYYTQEEAREVVQYAKNRGIRVIPEIDIP